MFPWIRVTLPAPRPARLVSAAGASHNSQSSPPVSESGMILSSSVALTAEWLLEPLSRSHPCRYTEPHPLATQHGAPHQELPSVKTTTSFSQLWPVANGRVMWRKDLALCLNLGSFWSAIPALKAPAGASQASVVIALQVGLSLFPGRCSSLPYWCIPQKSRPRKPAWNSPSQFIPGEPSRRQVVSEVVPGSRCKHRNMEKDVPSGQGGAHRSWEMKR